MIMFGMITAAGLSNLQFVDRESDIIGTEKISPNTDVFSSELTAKSFHRWVLNIFCIGNFTPKLVHVCINQLISKRSFQDVTRVAR